MRRTITNSLDWDVETTLYSLTHTSNILPRRIGLHDIGSTEYPYERLYVNNINIAGNPVSTEIFVNESIQPILSSITEIHNTLDDVSDNLLNINDELDSLHLTFYSPLSVSPLNGISLNINNTLLVDSNGWLGVNTLIIPMSDEVLSDLTAVDPIYKVSESSIGIKLKENQLKVNPDGLLYVNIASMIQASAPLQSKNYNDIMGTFGLSLEGLASSVGVDPSDLPDIAFISLSFDDDVFDLSPSSLWSDKKLRIKSQGINRIPFFSTSEMVSSSRFYYDDDTYLNSPRMLLNDFQETGGYDNDVVTRKYIKNQSWLNLVTGSALYQEETTGALDLKIASSLSVTAGELGIS